MASKNLAGIDRRTFLRGALVLGGTALGGFFLSGCGNGVNGSAETPTTSGDIVAGTDTSADLGRMLVVYYTCPEPTGVDTVAGASRVVVDGRLYGNIEYVANLIQAKTGADMFVIDTVQTYPADHDELIQFAVAEMDAGTLPELTGQVTTIDDYDTVFLGYPIWNAQLPMPVRSFLDECDLSGKAVYAFTVHGGSNFGGTIDQIEEAEPGAQVIQGFSVSRNNVADAEVGVSAWLAGLGVDESVTQEEEGGTESVAGRPAAVVYFSHQGHTRAAAETISERAGADIFEIVPVTPYPDGMAGAASVAEGELDENARPAIQPMDGGLGDAEVVFLGYPIWYVTAPMVVGTWLDQNASELAGKVVVPFCTSSYTTIGEVSMDFVRTGAPDADVRAGCTANGTAAIDEWLAGMGFGE